VSLLPLHPSLPHIFLFQPQILNGFHFVILGFTKRTNGRTANPG
jgi:hypothetical protein